ncbi:cytochrome P450 [Streptomyces cavernae]|uniref:bifunctional albaflavenone monooxygenase/terpene synthase n=1 Tax=Streptomyces cavernae TaxID=2259034 RepID=UPI001EE3E23D|nr:cytochrome P450 [Streptomyces cavernae]
MSGRSAIPVRGAEPSKPRTPPRVAGGVPGLGHGWQLARDPLAFVAGLRDHGDLVRITLGPKTVYAVCAPDLVAAMLRSPHYEVDGPMWEVFAALLGQGVATSNGSRHRRQRRTVQPAFRPERMPEYLGVMQEEARALADRWQPGQLVDIVTESFRIAVRITTRCLLRVASIDEIAERVNASLNVVFMGLYRRMVLSAGPLHRLPLPANRRFERALADLHRLADEIIAERRTAADWPDDLLTAFLKDRDEDGSPIREQEVHDQVVSMLVAGVEAEGTQLMWTLRTLAERPDLAARVRAEAGPVVADGRTLTVADLRGLTHTNNVVTETMRLRPGAWILMRRATVGTELGGYRIPAGADLVFSPYAIQRDPRSFERPLAFDPDRWLPERSGAIPAGAMLPFSAGNRKCPGNHFAVAELATVAANLISRWRLEPLPGADDSRRIGFTLVPKHRLLRVVPH